MCDENKDLGAEDCCEMSAGTAYSVLAGLLGALASCAAKLAVTADYLREVCRSAIGDWFEADIYAWFHVLLRLGCGALVFACNAVMWTFFAKALRCSSSSAVATVTTTASNFISSALLGKLLFGESRVFLWWVGITITLSGLFLVHTAKPRQRQTGEKEE
ncbi:transmembrane protein 42 isoform X2 [Microcaecilia unicolor]|uniref:Transmembrane protein 42 isoform X2 n=1 Tax=Microcaecilia unicolor TaxID=1415580 RepID=A0A6P7WXP1_9AMPH|nr:transmembrane protein 42 isoform X2 [Microcaecilia unicolor]